MTEDPASLRGYPIRYVRYAAAVLAAVVAGVHLLHPQLGGPRLLVHLQVGTLFDPRPIAFVLSAFLILFGIMLVYNRVLVRLVYVGGIVLMLTYLFGYAAWHTVLEHGAFWPHIEAHGHHDAGVFEIIWIHLVDDTIAMASKLLEAALLVLLVVLYRVESRTK